MEQEESKTSVKALTAMFEQVVQSQKKESALKIPMPKKQPAASICERHSPSTGTLEMTQSS